MMDNIRPGNIGVRLSDDAGELYRVRFCNDNPLIKIERLADNWTAWLLKEDFWVLIDQV
jgi:hypothetical protein